MAEIVSLNRVRKAKARLAKSAQSDANRAKFGRSKAEREADDAAASKRERLLDDAKRED